MNLSWSSATRRCSQALLAPRGPPDQACQSRTALLLHRGGDLAGSMADPRTVGRDPQPPFRRLADGDGGVLEIADLPTVANAFEGDKPHFTDGSRTCATRLPWPSLAPRSRRPAPAGRRAGASSMLWIIVPTGMWRRPSRSPGGRPPQVRTGSVSDGQSLKARECSVLSVRVVQPGPIAPSGSGHTQSPPLWPERQLVTAEIN